MLCLTTADCRSRSDFHLGNPGKSLQSASHDRSYRLESVILAPFQEADAVKLVTSSRADPAPHLLVAHVAVVTPTTQRSDNTTLSAVPLIVVTTDADQFGGVFRSQGAFSGWTDLGLVRFQRTRKTLII